MKIKWEAGPRYSVGTFFHVIASFPLSFLISQYFTDTYTVVLYSQTLKLIRSYSLSNTLQSGPCPSPMKLLRSVSQDRLTPTSS